MLVCALRSPPAVKAPWAVAALQRTIKLSAPMRGLMPRELWRDGIVRYAHLSGLVPVANKIRTYW